MKIEVSNGELFDKLTILEIKLNKIKDKDKLSNLMNDQIRLCEKQNIFDIEFVELARSVYKLNDERHDLKKEIDKLTNSKFSEEKSYSKQY